MPHIPITLLYGSLTLLLLGGIGFNVSRVRGDKKASLHDTPDRDLHRVIRAHGNAAEWVPGLILMLLILELSGASANVLNILGITIVLARVLHAAGMLTKTKLSVAGATATYALSLGMPIYGLVLHFRG